LKHIKFILGNHFLIFLLIALFTISCNKNEEIGSNIQPSENLLGVAFQNNIPITAHTVLEDSVRTDETILNMIGSYFDPVFGFTTAGMYTQFRLSSSNIDTAFANSVCDSIVLSLAYNGGFYGAVKPNLILNVFEISDDFYLDKNYYSNDQLGSFKNNLANISFVPNLRDSVKVDGTMSIPQLRVKLKKSLGEKFINASSGDLVDNTSFLKFFKGLYITTNKVNSDTGSIFYINTTSSVSKLTLYYHKNSDTISRKYNFVINENCARFNTFDHYDYYSAVDTLKNQIKRQNPDTTLGEGKLYLQAMAGTKIRLKFQKAIDSDYFENTPINKVAINKAELVIKVDPTTIIDKMPPPSILSLVVINNDGTYSFLPDVAYGEAYFGGSYNSTTHEYRFNISKYFQNTLSNGSFNDKGLFIVVSGAAVKGNRAVIFGPKSINGNMRLEIIYTKLK
jgi:hypothetical protein